MTTCGSPGSPEPSSTGSSGADLLLRTHQRLALEALDVAWAAGRSRAWVALPPGAGKTLVGLETVRRRIATGAVGRAVVLGPNTAIQGQWVAQAQELGLEVGTERTLTATLTALTYQSLAVFESESDDDAEAEAGAEVPGQPVEPDEPGLLARLHDNGRALVGAMQAAGPIVLVLDECHHLLEVWGRLLQELLDLLPDAEVLGLTATPPETMTAEQAELVDDLFGKPLFQASIPAVVREGDLAPFVELAWLTTPTPSESDWLASEAARFQEFVTQLTDPAFGTTSFFQWLDARFVTSGASGVSWATLVKESPELCRAALRMTHAGLLGQPAGVRLTEEHRSRPTADDWVLLVEDWLTGSLMKTGDPADEQVVEAVRRALPAVGYQWTRQGIRRGRSSVDRVLARSESKMTAVVQIVGHEHLNIGDLLRMLVLCDHERASATLPSGLVGVIDQQSGSAHAMLTALVADPNTTGLHPMLVTGKTVAGSPETLAAFLASMTDPELAARLRVEPLEGSPGFSSLVGPWTSRIWVAHVTRFFQEGDCRVLVGTRALLGEGWDARRITGLADLTAATTITSVVQTRGRALRIDPAWSQKVAVNWSIVCVAQEHPKGANDWDRLVRKHSGFFGLDDAGDVVDGVAHIDATFSPYAPPPTADFDAINAHMVVRSEAREDIRELWRVGEPYVDEVAPTVRVIARAPERLGTDVVVPTVVVTAAGLEMRRGRRSTWRRGLTPWLGAAGLAAVAAAVVAPALLLLGAGLLVGALGTGWRARASYGREVLADAGEPPSMARVACAVADGLKTAGLTAKGADAVHVEIEPDGEYRCVLRGVTEAEGAVFATAFDEAVSPLLTPRYVLPRWVLTPRDRSWWTALRAASGKVHPDGVVWHAVPTVLGINAQRAKAYGDAWHHWLGGGAPIYTGSPVGFGVLSSQQGSDPFEVTTVMRRHWS